MITFGDVATVRKSFRDPESFARLDGKPAIVLDIKNVLVRTLLKPLS